MPLRAGLGPYVRHHVIKEDVPSSPGWFNGPLIGFVVHSIGSNVAVLVLLIMVESRLPPKLDLILRRLVALRAPKVPGFGVLCKASCGLKFNAFPLSKVFVITILLIGHLDMCDMSMERYQVLEFYAGAARLAKLSRNLGLASAAMDIVYDQKGNNRQLNNAHDMNTSGGFVSLGLSFLELSGGCLRMARLLIRATCFELFQARLHPRASSQVG